MLTGRMLPAKHWIQETRCRSILLCQGAASIVGHAGIGFGSRQRLIGMAGMLQLASMPGMLQLVSMPEEHATCMTMITKLLSTVESHSWPRM
jgi:hypothetical protein